MSKNKIFISHSSKDIHYVKAFVENILILGLDIPSERIFCTSIEGQGVRSGQYIPDKLRQELNNSSLAILFVSESYKSSEVCLNELGAAWAILEKENIIPLVLPDITFNELGFLDRGRLGLKIADRLSLLKFVQDCKEYLNPNFNIEKLYSQLDIFFSKNHLFEKNIPNNNMKVSEWEDCFENNLYALNKIIRKAIPTCSDGVHQIKNINIQNQLLSDLSNASFLKRFWFRFSRGDYYVEKLSQLPSGNWLMSTFNWEIKISEMWVSMNCEFQYEFILIKSAAQEPYIINSDIGGESLSVGVLNNGIIVSENERLNGYAVINGVTIDLDENGVEPRHRRDESNWIFLVSNYHKLGYNPDETIKFCEMLDSEKIEVNEENIMRLLNTLRNNPIVSKYR